MSTKTTVTIRELSTEADFQSMHRLVKQLNKDMSRQEFNGLLKEMRARGYRCAGAFSEKKLIGLAGFWIGYRFWCGKHIDLDNVVTDKAFRSTGIGQKLVAWIEKLGRKEGCEMAGLDSYTTAHGAHRFYFRQGYSILGYHFTKDL